MGDSEVDEWEARKEARKTELKKIRKQIEKELGLDPVRATAELVARINRGEV